MLKKEILRNKDDFSIIYRKGKSIGGRYIVLFYRKNNLPYNRTAFLASKKVGNSVVRHHLCRLVRESYRLNEDKFDRGLDLVVIVRPGARELPFSDIDRALLHVSRKLGVLQKTEGAEKKNTIGESR